VCRIKEQNVGWDEFGTYDVKGLTIIVNNNSVKNRKRFPVVE